MRTVSRLAAALTVATCLLLNGPMTANADPGPTADPAGSLSVSPGATPAVTNITYSRVADPTVVRVSWTPPDVDNIYTYTVRLRIGKTQQMQATTNTRLDVGDVKSGVTVQAAITATANGTSGPETDGAVYTQPNPAVKTPVKVSITQLSKTSLRVTWAAGDDQGQSYLVNLTGGSGASPKQVGGTSIDFTGLSAGYDYTATVTAVADDSGYQSLPSAGKKLTLDPKFGPHTKPPVSTPLPTVTVTTHPSATTTVRATPTQTTPVTPTPSPRASAAPATDQGNDALSTILLTIAALTSIGIVICAIGLYRDRQKYKRRQAAITTGQITNRNQ